jgi:magnesium/cobalt transport protein CorA
VSASTTVAAGNGSTTALLFDRDEVEELDDWAAEVNGLRRSSILWIDLQRPDENAIGELADALGLHPHSVERLGQTSGEPFFADFGPYLHVTAYAPSAGSGVAHELERVGCLVSKRWVVTVHEGEIPVLQSFRDRAGGTGETGRLDGLEFLAVLLDWVLEGYLDAFEEIEVALEKIDAQAMEGRLEKPETALGELVELRREVGRLRRAIVSHRRMFLSLTRPELEGMSSEATADRFSELRSRLEEVVQAARDSRDSIVGSFDVLIARTGQRTNEIMKVLTLASVLLLPGALIAGVLGMNFKVGFFDHAALFWLVLALIGAIAAATLLAARVRRWV